MKKRGTVNAPSAHAILSPSSAARWMTCNAAPWMEQGRARTSSRAADAGTAGHELAEICLAQVGRPMAYVGRVMPNGVAISDEMAGTVEDYVTFVRDLHAALGGTLLVEVRFPLHSITGENNAQGTADAVILTDDEIIVIDLKTGRTPVSAVDNEQLQIYALAALRFYALLGDFKKVRLIIHQQTQAPAEHVVSVEELENFGTKVSGAARACMAILRNRDRPPASAFSPTTSACQWCLAKGDCEAQTAAVLKETNADFEDLTPRSDLGEKYDALEFVENWCKDTRAKVREALGQGLPVVGKEGAYRLVRGKPGNRAWRDREATEAVLVEYLDEELAYDWALISPTSAEKLAKKKILPATAWAALQSGIVRAEGGLSVAPAKDPRPAVQGDTFEDFTVDSSTDI